MPDATFFKDADMLMDVGVRIRGCAEIGISPSSDGVTFRAIIRPTSMSFVAGTKLGTYEIVEPLGAGGMGEVYRARDLKLKREVAIKILPDALSRDADRVIRFKREAEVLASLNHPNIAAIHSLEEANGSFFLVLELVEGETLDDRIRRGPVSVDEALDIAK